MTRAKENLTIHLNSNFLDNITAENLERVQDQGEYSAPDELVMHLTFRDVWLDYFIARQHLVVALRCGDTLVIAGDECMNPDGRAVIKFSSKFLDVIEAQKQKGYILRKAKVNFNVYWKKEGVESEMQVVLPELYFEKEVGSLRSEV